MEGSMCRDASSHPIAVGVIVAVQKVGGGISGTSSRIFGLAHTVAQKTVPMFGHFVMFELSHNGKQSHYLEQMSWIVYHIGFQMTHYLPNLDTH